MIRPARLILACVLLMGTLLAAAWRWMPETAERRAVPPVSLAPQLDFIRYEHNRLQFRGDSSRWNNLFEQLGSIAFDGQGHVSVVHIGGSHVQGGWLTDRMRRNFSLLTYGTEAERGFVFPYAMAGTNSPRSIECAWTGKWTGCRNSVSTHSCDWGMSGISATTTDSVSTVSIAAHNADSLYYSFDRIVIYHQGTQNMCIEADPFVTVHRIYENPVDGYTEFHFTPAVQRFTFSVRRMDEEEGSFTLQGMYLGREATGVTYHTIGVNGAGTYSYLKCGLFGAQLTTLRPDLVVFGIGVNDANVPETDFDQQAYEARYDSLIRQFLAVNPGTCFLFITNNDTYYNGRRPNRNALKVRDAMFNLAGRYDGAVYDLFNVMGGLGSIDTWVHEGLAARDRIHFSRRGYELQADLMYDAFRQALGDYLSGRGM